MPRHGGNGGTARSAWSRRSIRSMGGASTPTVRIAVRKPHRERQEGGRTGCGQCVSALTILRLMMKNS
jgi:hypothetical protein